MQITIREPGSAITHFIGMLMAGLAAVPLMAKAGMTGSGIAVGAMMIFAMSMMSLYGASTLYHSVNVKGKVLKVFKKIDHMMIFVLIAGSYTPVCLLILNHELGYPLLIAVWSIAIVGMFVKLFWVTCPKWFSSVIYIAMGWVCVFVFRELLESLPVAAFLWLLVGGLLYTAGGVIYAFKFSFFNAKHKYFGSHEIFHLFVMAGSICHFIFMYHYVL